MKGTWKVHKDMKGLRNEKKIMKTSKKRSQKPKTICDMKRLKMRKEKNGKFLEISKFYYR